MFFICRQPGLVLGAFTDGNVTQEFLSLSVAESKLLTLLVDDINILCDGFKCVLQGWGYQPVGCGRSFRQCILLRVGQELYL